MTSSQNPIVGEAARFRFPDGLRGLAALMVVVYHLHANLRPSVQAWFPSILSDLLGNGNLGVDVFFVLSGFVIAHSVSTGARTWRYLGWFALRRSIRLDPPMWATILAEIALMRISLRLYPELGTVLPSWQTVAANVTYSQHFLGLGDVVPVLWSLTFEVQFYIVLVGGLVLLHKVNARAFLISLIFLAAFLYSLGIWLGAFPNPLRGLFIERWFQFSLGIAAWVTFERHIRWTHFGALCSLTLLAIAATSPTEYRARSIGTALLTAAMLTFVGLSGRMASVLSGRVWQFLGRISYSLYLIHLSVGWRFVTFVRQRFGPELGPLLGTTTFVGGVGASVLAAWMMHLLLEAPSIRLARRIRLPVVPPVSDSGVS